MAYFPNGTEGLDYEARYCEHCLHLDRPGGCPVLTLHDMYNYEECNKPDSFLNILIPRSKDKLSNEQCRMFVAVPAGGK